MLGSKSESGGIFSSSGKCSDVSNGFRPAFGRLCYNEFVMIITALSLLLVQSSGLKCPVMPSHEAGTKEVLEYAGASFGMCCAGCVGKFEASPTTFLTKAIKEKNTIGTFLFDPVTGTAIKKEKAKATVDYNGIRYYFSSEANLSTFKESPKKFTATPKMESLVCPVMKSPIASYSKANGYVDYKGTRYYMCSAGCDIKMKKSPEQFVSNVTPSAPKAIAAPAK